MIKVCGQCIKKAVLAGLVLVLVAVAADQSASAVEVERSGHSSAPALVFIPGLASHGDVWKDVASVFAKTHQVYVVTAPGFAGTTPRQNKAPFLKTTVQEVASALKEDRVQGAIVVGHSIGGLMTLMLAKEAPELVEHALVVDSLPFLAGLFVPGATPETAKAQAAFLRQQMENMPRNMFDAQQKQGLARLTNTAAFLPTLEKWSAASDQKTVAQAFGEALGLDYRQQLASIQSNVTVLAAHSKAMPLSRDQLTGIFNAQYSNLLGVEIQIVDDSHHFIMVDQPDVFKAALKNIIAGE